MIPHGVDQDRCAMMHLHVDNDAVLADRNIALPDAVLDGLAVDGVIGAATDQHVSVMGYQGYGDDPLRVLAGAASYGTRVDVDIEWPQPRGEAYKAWQPEEPSPIVKVLLEQRQG